MSSSFRSSLALLLGLVVFVSWASTARAISVNAIYRSACERDLGVIIDVHKRELTLLGLDGRVRRIPRYEVVAMAYYPASYVDIEPGPVHQEQPAMRITTLQDGTLVTLVDGWPVDFNEERIAFIGIDGREVLVSRDKIWSLEYIQTLPPRTTARRHSQPWFVHPHAVGFCNRQGVDERAVRPTYPQQFINDRVVIKRELDRLMEGHQVVREYERDQIFYPVPQLYEGRTVLGVWTSHGSKHGALRGRPNNYTPVLVDEVSFGPFSYQHVLITGAAPMPFSLHTEVQTQIYYRFKAAYFHASAMFDPNLLLVGEEYFNGEKSLASDRPDVRVWEFLMVELGFDLGPVSLQASPGGGAILAARSGDVLVGNGVPLFRFGPRVRGSRWMGEGLVGFSEQKHGKPVRWGRVNGWFEPNAALRVGASFLIREIDWTEYSEQQDVDLRVEDRSYAGVLEGNYTLSHRYDLGARLSIERSKTRASVSNALSGEGNATQAAFAWYVGLNF